MISLFRGSRLGRVLVDLNTQRDFLDEDGALAVRNRAQAVPAIRLVFEIARQAGLSVISSLETHNLNDSLFGVPIHCIENTRGQDKLPFTLLSPRIVVETSNNFDLPYNVMSRYQQIVFRKQDADFFNNPKADRLLTELQPTEFMVFGATTEKAVKAVALGLLARHKKVAVIADACGYWSEADADLCLRQMAAKGIRITSVPELVELVESARRRLRARLGGRVRAAARADGITRRSRHPAGGKSMSPP